MLLLIINVDLKMFRPSTSFISKHEGPKTIIEGSGSVKVKDEQKSANFKYISTQLTEGNEQGIEVIDIIISFEILLFCDQFALGRGP